MTGVLAEDSFGDDSVWDSYGQESEDLFSSPGTGGVGTLEHSNDITTDIITEGPTGALGRIQSRRLFVETTANKAQAEQPVNEPRRGSESDSQCMRTILEEVRQANARLDMFASQLQSLETRLASVESHQISMTPSSSSDGSATRKRRKVPLKVSVGKLINIIIRYKHFQSDYCILCISACFSKFFCILSNSLFYVAWCSGCL